MKVDLNCDLGEGEPVRRTRALMGWVTSVNVACGGHAGDVGSMTACVRLAKELGVRLGAHPGLGDREGFGRREMELSADRLELLLLQQVGALERVARGGGLRLSHVKLHGALYHAVETRPGLRRAYLRCMARWWPRLRIYARAGGEVVRAARRSGVPVWEEVFADRAYDGRGGLVARSAPGAVITSETRVMERVKRLMDRGTVATRGGGEIRLSARTLCVHSDSARSVALARAAWRALSLAG